MLIDDVMTTGATLFEAAKTLQKSGAGPICGLVIARVN
jgi:predicted amidophosphoribosyltransferase